MSNLSRKQKEVVDLMKAGAVLKTNEGENWKAWLVYIGLEIKINRRTAVALFDRGIVKPVVGKDDPSGVFTYALK